MENNGANRVKGNRKFHGVTSAELHRPAVTAPAPVFPTRSSKRKALFSGTLNRTSRSEPCRLISGGWSYKRRSESCNFSQRLGSSCNLCARSAASAEVFKRKSRRALIGFLRLSERPR